MTATLTAPHAFTASLEDRRRCTCGKSRNVKAHGYTPSRGAGRAAAEKLNEAETRQQQAADTAQAAEDAVAAIYANFTAKKAAQAEARPFTAEENTALEADAAAELAAEQATIDAAEAAREAAWEADRLAEEDAAEQGDPRITTDPAELAVMRERAAALDALPADDEPAEHEVRRTATGIINVYRDGRFHQNFGTDEAAARAAVSGWNNPHACTPVVLPSQARKAAKPAGRGRKADPNTRALWVARELVAIILDSTDPAHAAIVGKLAASVPNNRGGRTIRLTAAEAELLSAIATEIETAVLDESLDVDDRGRLARSCVTMRARLAALWA